MYLMISVYNESLICDCDGAEILRPQHFVVICELMSTHDEILSRPASGKMQISGPADLITCKMRMVSWQIFSANLTGKMRMRIVS